MTTSSALRGNQPSSPPLLSFLYRFYNILSEAQWDIPYLSLLLLMESLLCVAIIRFVPYTEIDWEAYMQEVETYLGGEYDYRKIRGGTGPLVYPAGFLYLFALLRQWTNQGNDVVAAQYLFAVLYVLTIALVLCLYYVVLKRIQRERQQQQQQHYFPAATTSSVVWCWRVAMALVCLSKRLHSIYVLRLFNDGPAMLLLYASVLCMVHQRWKLGCFVFSLAVSIKMNILLFAPGLLLLLLQVNPTLLGTIQCLAICAVTQLVLGAPFLLRYPESYLRKAFELDRVFFYKWTVNWKFLPESIFLSKTLAVVLLVMHLGTLAYQAVRLLQAAKTQVGRRICWPSSVHPTPEYILYTLFLSNFVGICFARTLHYQFYCWYISSVPLLLLLSNSGDRRPSLSSAVVLVLVMVSLEYSFHIFPATPTSSALLQLTHAYALAQSLWREPPAITDKPKVH